MGKKPAARKRKSNLAEESKTFLGIQKALQRKQQRCVNN